MSDSNQTTPARTPPPLPASLRNLDGSPPGPKVQALLDHMTAKGVVMFSAGTAHSYGVPGAEERPDPEQVAEAMLAVELEMADPLKSAAARLRGEAGMLSDTVTCTRQRKRVVPAQEDGSVLVPEPPSREEESLLRGLESALEVMLDVADELHPPEPLADGTPVKLKQVLRAKDAEWVGQRGVVLGMSGARAGVEFACGKRMAVPVRDLEILDG